MTEQGAAPFGDRPPVTADASAVEVLAIAARFQDLADQVLTRLPLYRRLCEAAADDLDVVRRLLLARPTQRVPNLLLAAVHDVLLAGEESLLADWYPSVPGQRGVGGHRARPVGPGADDPWPHFRHLALEHPGVEDRVRHRATQTNEVGRCLTLLPALFEAGRWSEGGPPGGVRPLGLVEVGASAGLNLRLNAYGYRYQLPPDPSGLGGTRTVVESVGSGARLMLEGALRGPLVPPLPQGHLPIETAVGIDLEPLAVTREPDARWLVACHWPEEVDRLDRLREAIALAQAAPPTVERGDAVDDVARHVRAVPGHALPVVLATWALTYLPVERQRAFLDQLDVLGGERDLALVYAEQPERVPGLPVPGRPDGLPDGRATALVLMTWGSGRRRAFRLADQHPHGTWLEWLHDSVTGRSLG